MRHAFAMAAAALVAAAPVVAQSTAVATKIAAVRDGTIRLHFPARPGVCGDGNGSVWTQRGDRRWSSDGGYVCIAGPVVVRLGRADNQTVSVRSTVGSRRSASTEDVDLGEVSASDAARYLIGLGHTMGGTSGDEALSAAALGDAGDLSTEFRGVVRDENAPLSSRKQALFWLGQSDVSTTALAELYPTLEARSLREHFTFVLSQRHDETALHKLIDIARADRDADVRRQAMFWLGQSKDPLATKFFRDILTP